MRARLLMTIAALVLAAPTADSRAATPRIVGGDAVPAGSRPAVANITLGGRQECSGSLIAPRWVLTAGHCASITGALTADLAGTPVLFPASLFAVQLGTVSADGKGGETHAVSRVLLNPGFSSIGPYTYDNALLEIATASAIAPMRLANDIERPSWQTGSPVTEAGFGATAEGSDQRPTTMRQTKVAIVAEDVCAKAYPNDPQSTIAHDGEFDARVMVCAGLPKGGHDVCQGDSGGPLLSRAGGQERIVGTTSTGNGCARPGYPSIFGRVGAAPLRDWIASVVPRAVAPGEAISGLRARPASRTVVTFTSATAQRVSVALGRGGRSVARTTVAARAGSNRVVMTRHRLAPGAYTLRAAIAGTTAAALSTIHVR